MADGMFVDEEAGDVKPWDRYFNKPPPQVSADAIRDGWKLLYG